MGTHLRVLSESYPMNTNMTGFRWFTKKLRSCVLWSNVASALQGLSIIVSDDIIVFDVYNSVA